MILLPTGCTVPMKQPLNYVKVRVLPDSCDMDLIRTIALMDIPEYDDADTAFYLDIESFSSKCEYCLKKAYYQSADKRSIWLTTIKWMQLKNDSLLFIKLYNFDKSFEEDEQITVLCRTAEVPDCGFSEGAAFYVTTMYVHKDTVCLETGNRLDIERE